MSSYSNAIILRVLYKLILSVYSFFMLSISHKYSVAQLCFFLDLNSLIIIALVIYIFKVEIKIHRKSFFFYLARTFFTCCGTVSWILALEYIGINETTAISCIAPIFTTILATIFYGEKSDYGSKIAILVALLGAYIILNPSFINISKLGSVMALCSALMWSCYDIVCKYQAQEIQENDFRQAFYSFLFSSIAFLPVALYQFTSIEFKDIMLMELMSSMSLVNIIILFISFKIAPMFVLMPLSYLDLVFTAIGSYWFLDQIMDWYTICGSLLIILSALFIFYRKEKIL